MLFLFTKRLSAVYEECPSLAIGEPRLATDTARGRPVGSHGGQSSGFARGLATDCCRRGSMMWSANQGLVSTLMIGPLLAPNACASDISTRQSAREHSLSSLCASIPDVDHVQARANRGLLSVGRILQSLGGGEGAAPWKQTCHPAPRQLGCLMTSLIPRLSKHVAMSHRRMRFIRIGRNYVYGRNL